MASRRRLGPAGSRRILTVLGSTVLWGGVLLVSAGSATWLRGWAYLLLCLLGYLATGAVVLRANPEVIEERGKAHSGTKPFDRVFAVFYSALLLLLPAVAGLDYRHGWSSMPWSTVYPGIALHALGTVAVIAAMAANRHLEITVRIQHDRGHAVVTWGPYRFVRHPMYTGGILQFLGAPLVLGTAWAFAVSGGLIAGLIVRTALEDRALKVELAGYGDYARRTRYRLIPRVW